MLNKMKKYHLSDFMGHIWLFSLLLFFVTSCKESCEGTYTYERYDFIYERKEDIRSNVKITSAKELSDPGKIYRFENYLLIVERGKGIHLINNFNLENPQPVAFIQIPGAQDMAVRGKTLYADSYMDLLSFDLSNINQPRMIHRVEDAFDRWVLKAPNESGVVMDGHEDMANAGMIATGLRVETVVEDVPCDRSFGWGGGFLAGSMDDNNASFESQSDVANGQGGSMARFTLYQQYLYSINNNEMYVFDLANPGYPVERNQFEVGGGIETAYTYKDNLFIGSQTGMFIYELSDPTAPAYASEFTHWRACDPVVVQNDVAYVTLRSNQSACGGFQNELNIIDVSNIYDPQLIAVYPMIHPYGLGIDGNSLFICEGSAGLKLFDTPGDDQISLLRHIQGLHAFDVIPDVGRKALLLIGEDGLFQYDYSNPNELKLLSTLMAR